MALVQLVILGIGLATFGISAINLDTLRDNRLLFGLLIIFPFLATSLCLLLALLPRTIQISLLIFISLWMVAELVFAFVNVVRPHVDGEFKHITKHGLFADDPDLGFKSSPNIIERHTAYYRKQKVFDVIYRTDQAGRRITPVDSEGGRPKFFLFFGCSMTFGWGLTERQTLPYYVGQLLPDYKPYNYGLIGWGPAQMLDILKIRDLRREIPQRKGYAVFLFIDDHLPRVIGASHIAGRWDTDLSHYEVDANGNLVRDGNFATGLPFRTLFYWLVDRSNVTDYFHFSLPTHYSDDDYRLTAEIFAQSQKLLQQKFKLQGFYVILSVDSTKSREKLESHLRRLGVKYLDFTALYDSEDVSYRVHQLDWHTSALANRVMARELVKELDIGAPARTQSSRAAQF